MGEFDDGALAFFEIEAGMRRLSGDFHSVFANALARRLDGALAVRKKARARAQLRIAGQSFR